jgi:L-lactate dehydrogenase
MPLSVPRLEAFVCSLFEAAGLDADKAATLAQLLVLTDAMGRRTHGLAMVPLYLAELAQGTMAKSGEPEVVKQRGVVALWDGGYLPGQVVVARAIDWAVSRAADNGIAAVTIRRSHHIGCLAALALRAVEQGFVALIANSDPAGARVAPYGGTEALFTPDPFAIGYPGTPNPVLVDICASITTTSMTRQKAAEGTTFAQPWLLDHEGRPTTDPRVLEHSTPRGSLQLIGGLDHGHKGFGLVDGRGAVTGARRTRPPRRAEALGRQHLRAGDRARAVCRPRRVRQADGLFWRSLSQQPADRRRTPSALAG